MILVSCGFDAHRDDPLGSMNVTAAGYRAMTAIVRSLAQELCGGRVLFVLEGGYAASSLLEGTRAVIEVMSSQRPAQAHEIGYLGPGSSLRGILEHASAGHARRWPGIVGR